jgi:acyl-CoA synthetase (AMP-forming)/AMP-acid ligase II
LLLPFDSKFINVKRITFGGEKSDSSLYEKLKELFPNAKITNIYASTELGTLLHSSGELFTIPEQLRKDVLIKDNELFVRAEMLGKSYDLVVDDGMYGTGDIVEIVSENPTTFKFKIRISDYVNVGGYKVNIQEVEEVLGSIEGVLMASVAVKSNSVLGNMLIASVVSDFTNSELSEKYIKVILKEKLQEFKIPRIIKIVERLEFTRTGKISKK